MSTKNDNIRFLLRLLCCSTLALVGACGDDDDPMTGENEEELITTVNVTLTGGGETITASWSDPEGDGNPVIMDPMALTFGTDYALTMEILNESESPAEDIGEEIQEEAEEHQFFYVTTGDILNVEINDVETDYAMNLVGDDLPVGLTATVTATAAGTGTLNIVLKHLPPVNGTPQKTGTNTINDGESDFDITFDVEVQ